MLKALKFDYRWYLGLLLALTFFKGVLWSIFTPIFQGPDEQQHYFYIQYIAEFGRLPDQRTIFFSNEVTKVFTALEFGKTFHTGLKQNFSEGISGLHEQQLRQIGFSDRKEGEIRELTPWSVRKYPPLYYFFGAFFYRLFYGLDFIERIYALRIVFLSLSLFTVYFTYRFTQEFFSDRIFSFSAATVVSFLPQFSFLSAVLNNDNLLIALISFLLALILSAFRHGIALRRMFILGLVGGFALLTKYQAIPIIIFCGGFVAFVYWRSGKTLFPDVFRLGAVFFLTVIAVSGWWYVLNYLQYHSLPGVLPNSSSVSGPTPGKLRELLVWGIIYVPLLLTDFLGEFGWGDIFLPDAYYMLFSFIVFMAFLGILYAFFFRKIPENIKIKFIFCAGLTISFFCFIFLFFLMGIYFEDFNFIFNQARMYFALLPVFATLFFLPATLLIPKRFQKILCFVVCFYFIAVNTLSLLNYLILGYYV